MKGPHPADLATAATSLAWDLGADLFPDRGRRRWIRVGVAGAGTAALVWLERDSLAEARAGLRSLRGLRQRIAEASTEEELDAVLAEVPDSGPDAAADPSPTWVMGVVVGSLAAEVALRRWTKRRIASQARFPRLPAALGRAALALVVGPATRTRDQPSRT